MKTLLELAQFTDLLWDGWHPGLARSEGPQFAPRYNQRKARRDARRVNRAVKR